MSEFDRNLFNLAKTTKVFLADHPEVIVTRADKGNATVVLDRDTYLAKMSDLLSDRETYTIVKTDPTKKIFNDLNSVLKRWEQKDYISSFTKRSLLTSDGVLPRAYGLPKIHKVNYPLRIIVSSINSPLHKFATFLHNCLYDNLPHAKSHICNSYELVDKLNNLYVEEHLKLISLDVVSLFTNVPIDLIIGGVAKRWHMLKNKIGIPYHEFLIGLRLVLDSTFFKFNGTIYKQIFGTPMGSPLSPICADLVLQDLEEQAIARLPFHIPFYFRYVDDIAFIIPSSFTDFTLKIFNSFHETLQFTIEIADNNCLNFLDVSIIINNNHIEFDWYRKPTFSGRFLNFFSQHPLAHKKGVVIGLTDKIFKLSHPRYHEKNFKFIFDTLLMNGYPAEFIFTTVTRRIKSLICSNIVPPSSPASPPSSSRSFFVISFIDVVSKHFKDIAAGPNKSLAFVVLNKLNRFIKAYKDPLPSVNHSNVVYKICCENCTASYVGQTSRELNTRVKEHISNINRPFESLSVVSQHGLERHKFNWDEVKILDEDPSFLRRIISEMIHITLQKNSLNVQNDTINLDKAYIYLPIIKSFPSK